VAKKKDRVKLKKHRVTVRYSTPEYNRLLWLAEQYAKGNVARWVRHATLEAERKVLK
jgi:hypothetical protein